MSKKVNKIIATILMLTIISISTYSFADVGSFDRYSSGSSSSSSSRRSSSSSSSRRSSSSSSSDGGDLAFFIVMLIIIAIVCTNKYKGKQKPNSLRNNTVSTNNINKSRSIQVAGEVMNVDKNFSEEKFISFTKELFVKLQNAWTAREWEPMRLFETPELFEQHKTQVQGYIDTNRINVMDRIAVDYAHLYSFRIEGEKEILEVGLKSTMKDYIIDATTKQVLEGNKTEDRHSIYKLTFERARGVKTQEETNEIKTTNCPNCGAPTKITSAGKCEYCDSVILTNDHGWVLSNLESFKN